MSEQKIIRVSAVIIQDSSGRVLTVRKRGTDRFMQPGGKPEPGETPAATAIREVEEELGLSLEHSQLEPMGEFSAAAANEPDHTVVCSNFRVRFHDDAQAIVSQVQPAGEIVELRWFPLEDLLPRDDVAPLLTEKIAPLLDRT